MPDSRQVIAGLISSYFGMLRGQDTYFQINITHEEGQGDTLGVSMTQLTNTVERSTERSDKRFDEFMTTAKESALN